jgi:hypothetical protein
MLLMGGTLKVIQAALLEELLISITPDSTNSLAEDPVTAPTENRPAMSSPRLVSPVAKL